MNSAEKALAYDLVHEHVDRGIGSTGAEIGSEIVQTAKQLKDMQHDTVKGVQRATAIEGDPIISNDRLEALRRERQALEHSTPHQQIAEAEQIDTAEVADIVEKTGTKLKQVAGTATNETWSDNKVGEARLGQPGSEKVEFHSAIEQDGEDGTVLNITEVTNRYKHEVQHTLQSQQWNAQSVRIADDKILTRGHIVETDSMNHQEHIDSVSSGYKSTHQKTSAVASASEINTAAESGDLISLAEKIRERRGTGPLTEADVNPEEAAKVA